MRLLAVCLTATNNNSSFDHRVGASKQHWRQFDADRLRRLEVDHQLVLRRCLHREVGRLLSPENAIDISGGAAVLVDGIRPITGEASLK